MSRGGVEAVVGAESFCEGAFAGQQVGDISTDKDRAELDGRNVVCEICSIPFDAGGRPVPTTLTERTMGISYEELERIPEVIAVAGGEAKTEALNYSG